MAKIKKQERFGKSDPRGRNVIMVGYEPTRKSYRVYDPEANVVRVTGDVRFDEDKFPLKQDTLGGGQLNSAPPSPAAASRSPSVASSNPFGALDIEDVEDEDTSSDELQLGSPARAAQRQQAPAAPRATRTASLPAHQLRRGPALVLTPDVDLARAELESTRSESPDPLDTLPRDPPPFEARGSDDEPEPLDERFVHAFAAAAEDLLNDEDTSFSLPSLDPINYKEALKSVQRKHHMAAKDKEIKKLEDLGTWSKLKAMDLPSGAKALDSMFVFKVKRDKMGRTTSFKARLVIKGCGQREGRDFKETFAPVAKFTSIRLLVALAAKHSYHVHQADVDSAFVQAELDPSEAVYMKLPEGMRDLEGYVGCILKLNKALYGLRQSARLWNLKVHQDLVDLGYRQTRTDACVYVLDLPGGQHSYIGLYVDDLLLVGPDLEEFQRVKDHLHGLYGIKDLGQADLLLGIRVTFVDGGIHLSVRRYLEAMIERFGLTGCKTLSTPMEHNLKLTKEDGDVDHDLKHRYLQAIGCLMYAMLACRPDICFAVSYLSRFAANPSPAAWNAVAHVMRYLAGTLDFGILYTKGDSPTHAFTGYSDSAWADDETTSRSTQGYAFTLSGGAISWSSKLQTRCAKSTTDAEYISLGHTSSEAIHIDQQLSELGEGLQHPFPLLGDNTGAIALTKEPRFHNAMKCVRLSEHLARELVQQKVITVTYIPTSDMVADVMTKSLPRPMFEKFRDAMGVTPLRASGGVATT
ncbi:hypothetical protein RQP46_008578 [Phenoliferia psychrophenolica]